MRFYQIGLGAFAEYAYLGSRNRSCYGKFQIPFHQLPSPLKVASDWEGVLVEAHAFAFYEVYESVRMSIPDALSNLTFILGAISTGEEPFLPFQARDTTRLREVLNGSMMPNIDAPIPAKHPCSVPHGNQLTTLFASSFSVEELIERAGKPDFVSLDMGGYELLVLAKFLEVCPTVTAYQIEAHSPADAQMIQAMFRNYDYEIVYAETTPNDRYQMHAVQRTQSATRGVQVLNPTMDSRPQIRDESLTCICG